MKDVTLAQSTEEQEEAITLVDNYETKVYHHFDLIMERFLGDKSRITKTRILFSNWKPIRSEVINLTRAGRSIEAALIIKPESVTSMRITGRNVLVSQGI